MDPHINRLLALQATDRFLIELAYRSVLAVIPPEQRAALLSDMRSARSRVTTTRVVGADNNASIKAEIATMVEVDVPAFADRIESTSGLRN